MHSGARNGLQCATSTQQQQQQDKNVRTTCGLYEYRAHHTRDVYSMSARSCSIFSSQTMMSSARRASRTVQKHQRERAHRTNSNSLLSVPALGEQKRTAQHSSSQHTLAGGALCGVMLGRQSSYFQSVTLANARVRLAKFNDSHEQRDSKVYRRSQLERATE